jgi:transcriptional regulator with XRE-family HTH domain
MDGTLTKTAPLGTATEDPGSVLKTIRAAKGWTLAEVSTRTGLPVSTLSKLENGKVGLSYDKLMKLGRGLGVDIAQLLVGRQSETNGGGRALVSGRRAITRKGEERTVDAEAYHYRCHAAELRGRSLHPMIVEVKARSIDEFGEFTCHAGEEFVYVVEGAVEFHCDLYTPVTLAEGDSIYFDAGMGHAFVAAAQGPCRILCACTGIPEV